MLHGFVSEKTELFVSMLLTKSLREASPSISILVGRKNKTENGQRKKTRRNKKGKM
jgi:hypothetical protein